MLFSHSWSKNLAQDIRSDKDLIANLAGKKRPQRKFYQPTTESKDIVLSQSIQKLSTRQCMLPQLRLAHIRSDKVSKQI